MPALKPAWPAAAALLTALIQGSGLLAPAERLVGDALQRTLPARSASKVAVVLIDEEALRQGGPWPWPRARLAQLVDRVADAGAQGVALDFLLPEARPGDDQLATALGRGWHAP